MNNPRFNDCSICKHEFEPQFEFEPEINYVYHACQASKKPETVEKIEREIRKYNKAKSRHPLEFEANPVPEPEPKTTVTVWTTDACLDAITQWDKSHNGWGVGHYSFYGTPDIDHVIRETLDKGALAIKVECAKPYFLQTIWHDKLGLYGNGYFPESRPYMFWDAENDMAIEQAITEYLANHAKQDIKAGDITITSEDEPALVVSIEGNTAWARTLFDMSNGSSTHYRNCNLHKASPDEVLDWFTKEVDGNLFVAYKLENGEGLEGLLLSTIGRGKTSLRIQFDTIMITTFIKHHNITPIPFLWWSRLWEEPQYPRRK